MLPYLVVRLEPGNFFPSKVGIAAEQNGTQVKRSFKEREGKKEKGQTVGKLISGLFGGHKRKSTPLKARQKMKTGVYQGLDATNKAEESKNRHKLEINRVDFHVLSNQKCSE